MRLTRRSSSPRWRALAGAAVLLGVAAGPAAQSPGAPPARAGWMTHHFADVLTLHDALVRGDLRAARATASHLVSEPDPPNIGDEGRARMGRLRALAGDIVGTSDMATAANATAGLVATCGECHESSGVRVPPLRASDRPSVGGIVGHMVDHREALESLLAGLVTPSTSEWQAGARRLETAALPADALPIDRKLTANVRAADRQVHELAGAAVSAHTTDARVESYGRLLATCATCHSLHPSVWGPGQ
jgi:cytochrome c553